MIPWQLQGNRKKYIAAVETEETAQDLNLPHRFRVVKGKSEKASVLH
jgi:hypothetical protein